ncbi:MAG: segregation and condensation protein A [Acidimicrobiales bacterium]
MAYEVRTAVFEGPFDLLLHLIVRDQVDVHQVSLSRIVDAFLTEIERMETLDLDVATEFLLIAATLVELKTRRLLPGLDDPDVEEELGLLEERDLLLARLLECKTFRDAGAALARAVQVAALSWPRTAGLEERFLDLVPDVLAGVTGEDLRQAYLRAAAPKPVARVDLDHVAPIRVSVADTVADLALVLPAMGRVTFRRLTEGVGVRLEVIVHFLAVLELYKQGRIEVEQAETFGELVLAWTGHGPDAAVTSDLDEDELVSTDG